ncbi:hypothetical protein [Limnoglobus roseus]|nr:hypothetical protein [Limnoglobus roseus]
MFLWGLFGQSELLAYGLAPVALLLTALQAGKAKRDGSVHSNYIGTSIFARWFTDPHRARYLEAAITVGSGFFIRDADHALGAWLIAAGLGHAMVMNWISRRETYIRADQADALHEARNRSGSNDRPPLF